MKSKINKKTGKEIEPYSKEWLTEQEVKTILELPKLSEKYETWILLLYTPALRVTEALNVRVRDLNTEKKEILVIGGKKRDINDIAPVPCNLRVLRQIKRYAERNDLKPSDYIMFGNQGKQVGREWVYRVLNKLCHEAGIDKKIGTHTLRRSRATHLLNKGIPLEQVSKYLRHQNLSTTMEYLKITTADIQKKLEDMGDPIDDIINSGY
jgi:integrase/recombinase XerD